MPIMTIRALCAALEERVPPSLSWEWDNDGLSCAPCPDAPVTGVLIALDPTEDAVKAAIRSGCNLLLTHHPMLFRGLKAVTGEDTSSRKVLSLIQNGITAMSLHTRLDAVEGGVNDCLAARLGLEKVEPFGDHANPAGQPIGRVGGLPAPVAPEVFLETLKKALGLSSVVFADCGKPVHRVAVVGGAGEEDIPSAVAVGADTYVTGEIGYHRLCDAPYEGINLVMAGHYHTEAPVLEGLARLCRELCPGLPVTVMSSTPVELR